MECPQCQERTPEGADKCLRCGATIDAEEWVSGNPYVLGAALIVTCALMLAVYWYMTGVRGAQSATVTVSGTEMELICVDADDSDAIRKLQNTGWKLSSGGFVDNDVAGKKCFNKER
jgi:hypothetical protein